MTARFDLNDEQRVQVEALAAYLSQEQIADYFGIARSTWYQLLERDPEVAERYKRGKSQAIMTVAQGLLQKARDGDTTSAIFYLKTQAGWRETNRVEHAGPDGGPVQVITRRIIDPAAGD
jgi:IS30 family transposase